ncbi:MAG: AI-2E family transporter [Deltaproteobacteria bacterium]
MSGQDSSGRGGGNSQSSSWSSLRSAPSELAVANRPLLSRGLFLLLGLLAIGIGLYELRGVLTPIFTALGIAYLLDPVVDRFEARRIPRGVGITIVLTFLALAVTLFSLLVLPGVIREVSQFVSDLPDELSDLVRQLEPVLARYDVPVPHSLDEALEQLEMDPATIASHAAQPVEAVLRGVLGGTASALGVMASALIVPVLAFYLLYDFDRMVQGARELVPLRIRPQVVEVASEIDQMLGQFVRGQLLVMIAMAVLYGIAYSLVGVRLAVPIALIAGLLAFIPYVGSGSALAMGLLMCVVDWDGWLKPVLVVVAYGVCQFLEGFVIVPRVVGDKVGLPAVWVLVALMIGGEVFGVLGVLLAVPTAAVVKIFVMRGLGWYRKSHFYLGGDAPLLDAAAPGVSMLEVRYRESPDDLGRDSPSHDAVAPGAPAASAPAASAPAPHAADAASPDANDLATTAREREESAPPTESPATGLVADEGPRTERSDA